MEPEKPVVYFATDHAGFALKNILLAYVQDELGYQVVDCGATEHQEDDDYPDFVHQAAKAVSEDPVGRRAIVLGHSGTGEAIVANRHPKVRAVVYYGGEQEIITLSRQHNDANVLSLGANFIDEVQAKTAIKTWLLTEYSQEARHERRISKIDI